jgi:hypothetical protein
MIIRLKMRRVRSHTRVYATVGGAGFRIDDGVIRHGSSGALFVRLHVLGRPIGEPVAALQEMDIRHARRPRIAAEATSSALKGSRR